MLYKLCICFTYSKVRQVFVKVVSFLFSLTMSISLVSNTAAKNYCWGIKNYNPNQMTLLYEKHVDQLKLLLVPLWFSFGKVNSNSVSCLSFSNPAIRGGLIKANLLVHHKYRIVKLEVQVKHCRFDNEINQPFLVYIFSLEMLYY